MPFSEQIKARLQSVGASFHAADNISEYIHPDEVKQLVDEAALAFEKVLDAMIIDYENDPNSMDTPRRLAKMYINELFEGRFTPPPEVTEFPNAGPNKYKGILVRRVEINSVCSHHWQPVTGIAYIGVLSDQTLIGLSKFDRLAQHCARRGTLQEALTHDIQQTIRRATGTEDVAVQIVARHGCCENRGVRSGNSATVTTLLGGMFEKDDVKNEFFHAIKETRMFCG